jgi:hypothetical protein
MWERLREASTQQPTDDNRWQPDPGDELMGIITSISDHDGRRGPYRILHVEQEDGSTRSISITKLIADALEESDGCPGDGIWLRFNGERKSQRGMVFKDFSISIVPNDFADGGEINE